MTLVDVIRFSKGNNSSFFPLCHLGPNKTWI